MLFALSLLDDDYGVLASAPDLWLRPGVIDGDEHALPAMLAYLTFYHHERIERSQAGNSRKARLVRFGVWLGAAGPFVLACGYGLPVALGWLQAASL